LSKFIVNIILFCSSLFVGHFIAIKYLPNFIYSQFQSIALSRPDAEVNKLSILLAPDQDSRLVVKPNPDFAYVTLFYDLDNGPISVSGQMPDSIYWSLALYQSNTVNYYVKNDLQYESNQLDISIVLDPDPDAKNEQIISPDSKGFMLIRVLIADRDSERQVKIQDMLNALILEK